jgi:hypothetical protein
VADLDPPVILGLHFLIKLGAFVSGQHHKDSVAVKDPFAEPDEPRVDLTVVATAIVAAIIG